MEKPKKQKIHLLPQHEVKAVVGDIWNDTIRTVFKKEPKKDTQGKKSV